MQLTSESLPARLGGMLACLTSLFIIWQLSFFFTHYLAGNLIDSLAQSSIYAQFFHYAILAPIIFYLCTQIAAYLLLIIWIWFLAVSLKEIFQLSPRTSYLSGILLWVVSVSSLLTMNAQLFPASFFSKLLYNAGISANLNLFIMLTSLSVLLAVTAIAYFNFFYYRRYHRSGFIILTCFAFSLAASLHKHLIFTTPDNKNSQPNVIIIGLDSLRPDFTHYFNHERNSTPNLDRFLNHAVTYTQAYTPLARTYPSWISILTAKYPLHHGARNNLVNPGKPLQSDNLARRMQNAGYETIYATDEKRFSNITTEYGFNRVLGPAMGANDFLLGSLTDFPMTNLLSASPLNAVLLPYHYGNRAAAITYDPDHFFQQLKSGLAKRSDKPLFLAVHFCLTHWPYTWSRDHSTATTLLPDKFQDSASELDAQLGKLFTLLSQNHLLDNTLVVILSDHGTALGMRGDNMTEITKYHGSKKNLSLIPVFKLSNSGEYSLNNNDYTIDTSYGQGNSLLSIAQQQVLMAFKYYGKNFPEKKQTELVSLIDITPTILDYLRLPALKHIDGISLASDFNASTKSAPRQRTFYMESGYSISEVETDNINTGKVAAAEIGTYEIDPNTSLLHMTASKAASAIKSKQRAILEGDWILAHYPAGIVNKLVPSDEDHSKLILKGIATPPYFIIANRKTGNWTIGLASPFARKSPAYAMLGKLKKFYGKEATLLYSGH